MASFMSNAKSEPEPEVQLEEITPENIKRLQEEQRANNEKASEVVKPYHEAVQKASSRLRKITDRIGVVFESHLRLLAGRKGHDLRMANVYENHDKEMQVSYYIGQRWYTCLLKQLLDKGEFESLQKKLEEEKIAAARRHVEEAAASAARAQKKLADLKAAKHD